MSDQPMDPSDRYRLRALCAKSVRGASLTLEEMDLCEALFRAHPDEYSEISKSERKLAHEEMNPMNSPAPQPPDPRGAADEA